MIDKLQTVLARYDELAELMNLPDAMQDMKALQNWQESIEVSPN